jgi:hypothetical protein
MNTKQSFLFLILIITVVLSCKNNDNVFKVVPTTGVTIINASADTLNFYVNGTRQNTVSSLFPAGSSGLRLIPSGLQNYQFKKAGKPDILFSLPLDLKTNTFNSIYITGESASKVFRTIDTLPLIDTLHFITSVRFVHAAPDAGNLDVFVGDTVNFKSRPFGQASVFRLTGSGQKRVKVYLSGSAVPKIDTIISFQSNQDYTLFAKGLLNGTGNSRFNVGILINQLQASF